MARHFARTLPAWELPIHRRPFFDDGASLEVFVPANARTQDPLENKVVLITGGTGSFGSAMVRHLLQHHRPKTIRVFSRDELKQFHMKQQLRDERLRFFLGDVRDRERVRRACEGVDIMIHAAALKQVQACEYNPFEAIKTNIIGSVNLVDAAIDCGVKKAIALSTDKAVSPVNLYGATKLCAEKVFIHGNSYTGQRGTKLACCRYGNVIGSRGSVIPLFLKQRATGKLTITDRRMTRFWITLDEAVRFVIQGLSTMVGGEIFVPNLPSMRIVDLAKTIAPDAELVEIGIRPGEKIHETLVMEEEVRTTYQHKDFYIILPEWFSTEVKRSYPKKKLPDDFVYNSGQSRHWVGEAELQAMIDSYERQLV